MITITAELCKFPDGARVKLASGETMTITGKDHRTVYLEQGQADATALYSDATALYSDPASVTVANPQEAIELLKRMS